MGYVETLFTRLQERQDRTKMRLGLNKPAEYYESKARLKEEDNSRKKRISDAKKELNKDRDQRIASVKSSVLSGARTSINALKKLKKADDNKKVTFGSGFAQGGLGRGFGSGSSAFSLGKEEPKQEKKKDIVIRIKG